MELKRVMGRASGWAGPDKSTWLPRPMGVRQRGDIRGSAIRAHAVGGVLMRSGAGSDAGYLFVLRRPV